MSLSVSLGLSLSVSLSVSLSLSLVLKRSIPCVGKGGGAGRAGGVSPVIFLPFQGEGRGTDHPIWPCSWGSCFAILDGSG